MTRREFNQFEPEQRLLSNGLKLACLKVSPPSNDACNKNKKQFVQKASISISINRGHFDSIGYPEGFAHLLEHMLFTSSESYVKADALDQHLFKFHGQVNGWTQDLSTHFAMQCDPDGFIKACEILIDRLAKPLFLHDHIQAEVSAIDAEFILKAKTPIRQLLSVQKASSNPAHPFYRFSTGNRHSLLSLGDVDQGSNEHTQQSEALTQEQLETLQKQLKTYHASTMLGEHISIAIGYEESSLSKDDLESVVRGCEQAFEPGQSTPIPSTQVLAEHIPVYAKEHLAQFIEIQTRQKNHQLLFSYLVTKVPKAARDSLFVMLTHTIESKHKRGLYDALKEQELIKDLQSYYQSIDAQTDELVISLQLSARGLDKVALVYRIVQKFLDFLFANGIEDWRYREKQQQFDLQSQLQRPAGLLENCINVSQQLPFMSAQECLQMSEFDARMASVEMPVVLGMLSEANLRLYLLSDTVEGEQVTPYYEARYRLSALSNFQNQLEPSQHVFSKSRQNPFMSTHHPMVLSEVPPTELQHFATMGAELKFYQNTALGKANGECYVSVSEPNMCANAQQIAIKRVWLECLQVHLAQMFFDVDLASIHFRVYAHQFGISIHTGGLSERQLLLAIELINAIKGFKAKPKDIEEQIESCTTALQANLNQKPFNRLFSFLNEFYQEPNKSNKHVLEQLQRLTPQDVLQCQANYFQDNYIESLLVGNWTLSSAARFFKQLSQRFKVQKMLNKPHVQMKEINLSQHIHERIDSLEESNLIRHFIPIISPQERNLASRSKGFVLQLSARCLVLEKLLANPVFDTLRQKHNMGYMLGVGYKPISRLPGIALYINSPTHNESKSYTAMNEAIETALSIFTEQQEMLEHLVDDLIKQVSPKDSDISQITARIWMHYEDVNPALAYEDMINALKEIEASEIRAALSSLLKEPMGHTVLTQSAFEKRELT